MLPGNDAVKHTARTALKSCWPQAIAVTLFCVAVTLCGILLDELFAALLQPFGDWIADLVFLCYTLLLLLPMLQGALRWFWRVTGGAQVEVGAVFYYFSDRRAYLRSLWLTLYLAGKALLYGVLLLLPGAVVGCLSDPALYTRFHLSMPYWATGLRVLSGVLTALGVLILCGILLRYYLAPLFLAAREDMTPLEAAHLSTRVSKQTRGAFLALLFSFVGWALLILLCAVPLFYAVPLFFAALAVHGRFAVFHYNQNVLAARDTRFPAYRAQF